MIVLIDNTAIHQLNRILEGPESRPLNPSDVMCLLHFAEHIMFAQSMKVSTFEIPSVVAVTQSTLDKLTNEDCIVGVHPNTRLISDANFTDREYADACVASAPRIQEDLAFLDPNSVKRSCQLANEATKPTGIVTSVLGKWIEKDWTDGDRATVYQMALTNKARGAYDFTVASNDALYHQLRILLKPLKTSNRFRQGTLFLDVFFRVAINQELARSHNGMYSPAPQVARIVRQCDSVYRHAVCALIQQQLRDASAANVSRVLQRIQSDEVLPLPLFAIYFLLRYSPGGGSPIKVLQEARKLRDRPEVRWVRGWLSEYDSNGNDMERSSRMRRELMALAADLKLTESTWISVLRVFETSLDQSGVPRVKVRPDVLAETLNNLTIRLSRRRLFLSAVARELSSTKTLGSELLRMIGRPIVLQ